MTSNIRKYISDLPTKIEKETVSFLAYYSLQSLETIKSRPHHKPITRVIAPNLLENPSYTGMLRPVVDVVWQTGEYIVQQKEEDGFYFISQNVSYMNTMFDLILYKCGDVIFRYIVEYNDESCPPYTNFTLIDIHKEVNEHIKISMKFEAEFPQMKHIAVNMAESVLVNE